MTAKADFDEPDAEFDEYWEEEVVDPLKDPALIVPEGFEARIEIRISYINTQRGIEVPLEIDSEDEWLPCKFEEDGKDIRAARSAQGLIRWLMSSDSVASPMVNDHEVVNAVKQALQRCHASKRVAEEHEDEKLTVADEGLQVIAEVKRKAKQRCNAKIAPPKKRSPTRSSLTEKQLSEQSLDEIGDFFREQQGLHCLFYATDEFGSCVITASPDPVSTLRLIAPSVAGADYLPTTAIDVPNRNSVVKRIHERVREITRRGYDFTFIWHLDGDASIHIQSSGDFDSYECRRDLYDAVQMELREYLAV